MRHALLRLFQRLNIDAHWYVMKPKPEIFEITKRKIHNVLHSVAKADVHLTDDDKELYETWCRDNVHYWKDGPLKSSDVIIIDDPQRMDSVSTSI